MPVSLYSRYYGLEPVTLDGVTSLSQRLLTTRVSEPDSLVHTIVGGETLDQLAARYYGRADLWWRIADANPGILPADEQASDGEQAAEGDHPVLKPGQVRFPLDWRPGDKLIIPPLRVATRTPRR